MMPLSKLEVQAFERVVIEAAGKEFTHADSSGAPLAVSGGANKADDVFGRSAWSMEIGGRAAWS
jgi:hypothetical protein